MGAPCHRSGATVPPPPLPSPPHCVGSQTGFVNKSLENLYWFDVPASATGFTVTLTAVYGDPDIYMNLNYSVTPTSNSYQYRAISARSEDSIYVNASDPNFAACVQNSFPDKGRCRAFIGIFGFNASQYRCG